MCGASYTDEQVETAEALGTSPQIVKTLDGIFLAIGEQTEGQPNYDSAVYADVVIPAYAVGVFGKVVAGWMTDSAHYAQTRFIESLFSGLFAGEADELVPAPGDERFISEADRFLVDL